MRQTWFRLGLKWVGMVLLLNLAGCAWLGDKQRQVIYRPTPSASPGNTDLPPALQHYQLALPGTGQPAFVSMWWLPTTTADAPTLLYLHGTFRNLEGNLHKINALHAAGFNILAVDYRGWGQSSAITPSEATIMADARLAWTELVRREPRAEKRVIYGHSMGSGVAVGLASTLTYPQDLGGLILESAFTSFSDVARSAGFWAGVVGTFSTERFASIDHIGQVHAPLLMFHGNKDGTVPMNLGAKLFDAAHSPKQWVVFEGGGHSDLDLTAKDAYQQALQAFKTQLLHAPTSDHEGATPSNSVPK